MMSNEWKLPLNMAIGLHVLVLLGAFYLPGIFKAKPKFADIYTVSIINIAEPAAPPPPPVKAQEATPPPVIAKPKQTKKIAPIAEIQDAPAPAPVPVKAVSLKPLKKKKINKVVKPKTTSRQKELERSKRQRLAKAIREEELLAEQAKLAREALDAERRLLQAQQPIPARQTTARTSPTSTSRAASGPPGGSSSLIESQYLASIKNRIHQFWALPEYLQKDQNLTSVVVVTIDKNGKIANMFFENKSDNRVFDQFVSKTINAADPLPPIPPAMKKQRIEVGLVFKPGGIQSTSN